MSRVKYLHPDRAGEIVTAWVGRPLEAMQTGHRPPKARPVVIVGRSSGSYLTVGLTTKACYADGDPRVLVPDPERSGLRGRSSYLWGGRLTRLSALDIADHIGWVHHEIVDAIAVLVELAPEQLAGLRWAADKHHPGPMPAA